MVNVIEIVLIELIILLLLILVLLILYAKYRLPRTKLVHPIQVIPPTNINSPPPRQYVNYNKVEYKPNPLAKSIIPKKPEQWFIALVYLIVLGIFAYFLLGNLFPDKVPTFEDDFTISASSTQIFDKLNSLSIDKDNILGQKETISNTIVRKIASAEAFNLVVKPKNPLKDNTPATLELNLLTNNSGTDIYMNDKPIIPSLVDYNLVQDFNNESVYINKRLSYSSLASASSAQEFVYKSFPGASVYSFSNLPIYVPELSDYRDDDTFINIIIRNNLKLAVYAKNSLEIRFTKQDLDQTVGKDEYTVEIKDVSGKSYFSKLYEDDGDKSDTNKIGPEQNFKITVNNLPKGIYYVTFTRDNYNKWEDSTIKNIHINSNKVLLLGDIIFWSDFKLYTHISTLQESFFHTYWKMNNTVVISGDKSKEIKLEVSGTKYSLSLSNGDYFIANPSGKFMITKSPGFSLTRASWFDIPKQNEGNLKNQDIIIIDKNKLKLDRDKISYKEDIKLSKDTKIKLQVIDENKVYLDSIKLTLK